LGLTVLRCSCLVTGAARRSPKKSSMIKASHQKDLGSDNDPFSHSNKELVALYNFRQEVAATLCP
jgi:hypothetical protein